MSSAASLLHLRVSPVAESNLRAGHPWLFAGSIRDQNREGRLGELAAIYDHKDQFLAIGLFDPESPIRVRVLHAGKPRKLDESWWRARSMMRVVKHGNRWQIEGEQAHRATLAFAKNVNSKLVYELDSAAAAV